MDSINNRELREQTLIQKPNTMEEALKLATHIEALDILETPKSEVRESHCGMYKVQSLNPDSGTGAMKEVGRQLADIKEALLDIRQAVQMLINQTIFAKRCRNLQVLHSKHRLIQLLKWARIPADIAKSWVIGCTTVHSWNKKLQERNYWKTLIRIINRRSTTNCWSDEDTRFND